MDSNTARSASCRVHRCTRFNNSHSRVVKNDSRKGPNAAHGGTNTSLAGARVEGLHRSVLAAVTGAVDDPSAAAGDEKARPRGNVGDVGSPKVDWDPGRGNHAGSDQGPPSLPNPACWSSSTCADLSLAAHFLELGYTLAPDVPTFGRQLGVHPRGAVGSR
jgi:hypothetical protein